MARIKVDTAKLKTKAPTECHVVPCKIHHNGKANVSKYFTASSAKEKHVRYLRGRKLHGHRVDLDKYTEGLVDCANTGVVLREIELTDRERLRQAVFDDVDEDAEAPRQLEAIDSFRSLTVWGHETAPDVATDPWISAVTDWIQLASASDETSNVKGEDTA